jgi:hypothetical protein
MTRVWWTSNRPSSLNSYIPAGMRPLDLGLAVLAAGGDFGGVNECVLVEVEAGGGEAEAVPAQTLVLKALLGHGGVPASVDVFGLDGGDVASVPRHHCVLGLQRLLRRAASTLLWKCA